VRYSVLLNCQIARRSALPDAGYVVVRLEVRGSSDGPAAECGESWLSLIRENE